MALLSAAQQDDVLALLHDLDRKGDFDRPTVLDVRPHIYEVIDALDAIASIDAPNVGGNNISAEVSGAIPTSSAFNGTNIRAGMTADQIGAFWAALVFVRAKNKVK